MFYISAHHQLKTVGEGNSWSLGLFYAEKKEIHRVNLQ